MAGYQPPFTITNEMVSLISSISEKLGQFSNYKSFESKPHLRKNNRIRSIHSSLAIEANSLSLDQVKSVIDGRLVIGPQKEIQEVKNAYKAYDEIGAFDPYSINDLKRMHGIMTYLTVDESGSFRRGEEGVFDGDRCIFMAPPAYLVPSQMEALFRWMQDARTTVHPLILSSVFHYEFVFIHPFVDGNGRMARLWQTAILTGWNPIFQYLPIESRIHEFQDGYYAAIARCHMEGSSNTLITFMLEKIDETLSAVMQQAAHSDGQLSEQVRKLLASMDYDVPYTAAALLSLLGLKSKEALRRNYLGPALELGLVIMSNPEKPTSRNQTYIKK